MKHLKITETRFHIEIAVNNRTRVQMLATEISVKSIPPMAREMNKGIQVQADE